MEMLIMQDVWVEFGTDLQKKTNWLNYSMYNSKDIKEQQKQ